jgi:hypothetical protein
MSLRELTNECIFDLARVWRWAWHGLSLYKRGLTVNATISDTHRPWGGPMQDSLGWSEDPACPCSIIHIQVEHSAGRELAK